MAHIVGTQREQRMRVARRSDKLHFERIGRMHFDDDAKIAPPQSRFRKIAG